MSWTQGSSDTYLVFITLRSWAVSATMAYDGLYAQYHPEMLYHTAAYKHVPLMESHPLAVVCNNTLGTYRLVHAAAWNRIDHMLMVSTDKAVRPMSIMGASKRMAELVLLGCATVSPHVTCVRLGNVLGSQDSIAGVFLDHIARGAA